MLDGPAQQPTAKVRDGTQIMGVKTPQGTSAGLARPCPADHETASCFEAWRRASTLDVSEMGFRPAARQLLDGPLPCNPRARHWTGKGVCITLGGTSAGISEGPVSRLIGPGFTE